MHIHFPLIDLILTHSTPNYSVVNFPQFMSLYQHPQFSNIYFNNIYSLA